ncbi:MAG: tRNA 2-thiouridine(34) synthase MnmA, partial [Actinomycetia bacterium]|nr:tRNA 2-thiouridine(34) synthase MnmA [Actinomycetes bacterium]
AQPLWCGPSIRDGETFDVQYRAHGPTVRGAVQLEPGALRTRLAAPASGIAPGQTMVLYQGSRVRGSATITSATGTSATGTSATGTSAT